jgi:hypothetical protein
MRLSKKEQLAFLKGVNFAAEVADTYNSCSTHPYMLGDCIKGKLNLLSKRKIRKNTNRLKSPKPKIKNQ